MQELANTSSRQMRVHLNARDWRQKRMFDVGHTSSGMTFDLRCSIRLRLRSWGA
jgi:hypothetical protein